MDIATLHICDDEVAFVVPAGAVGDAERAPLGRGRSRLGNQKCTSEFAREFTRLVSEQAVARASFARCCRSRYFVLTWKGWAYVRGRSSVG